jgi:hypothetical protein
VEKSLLKLKDYGVFTFISTSHALKAERVLKNASADFLMMPTPREISTSCGLAIKVAEDGIGLSHEILNSNRVEIDGVYRVRTINGKTQTERLYNE